MIVEIFMSKVLKIHYKTKKVITVISETLYCALLTMSLALNHPYSTHTQMHATSTTS